MIEELGDLLVLLGGVLLFSNGYMALGAVLMIVAIGLAHHLINK